jgi:hypothetical protein
LKVNLIAALFILSAHENLASRARTISWIAALKNLAVVAVFNEFNRENGPKSVFPLLLDK